MNNLEACIPFKGKKPFIDEDVFLAPGSKIIGDVVIGKGSSIWFNAVLRGDVERIEIGEYTNIQDNAVVHCDSDIPTDIGSYVTIGHNAVIHACMIQDHCLIGMGAIVMDGALIGEGSVIGAGTIITKNKLIPPYSLVIGSPAEVVETLDESTKEKRASHALRYYENTKAYKHE